MSYIEKINTALKNPLPGAEAQYKMSHVLRRSYKPPPADHKKAAVLLLIYPKDGQPHIVLTERASHHKDSHSGQMSFPGGRKEKTDQDLNATALREAEEEIGLETQNVKVLGLLSQLYIPVSNFLVQPVLAIAEKELTFKPEPSEVKEIIEAPLSLILDENTKKEKDIRISERMTLKAVPYFDVSDKIVWGATAMMMNELVEMLR